MSQQWVQFLAGGLTVGAIYALVALGFSIIFNASRVINFAQGEFVMIGGMSAVSLVATGLPMPIAIAGAVVIAGAVGLLLEKFAVERARRADVVTLIIITIGASILLRGVAQLVWDKRIHALPPLGLVHRLGERKALPSEKLLAVVADRVDQKCVSIPLTS